MSRRIPLCAAFLAAMGMALISTPSLADQGDTERVSVSSTGEQGNCFSYDRPSISANGRYVAFESAAWNLVPDDTNAYCTDIFMHDRVTNATERVSVSSSGEQANGRSYGPSISADGRYVAFDSQASNLVPSDTNGCYDVFVHDRLTNETVRVSITSSGVQGDYDSRLPSISADGRYVAFHSYALNLAPGATNGRVFVHDRLTNETVCVSVSSSGVQGNKDSGHSFGPSISADGRYVAFDSRASNLIPGDTNTFPDIFVHDRVTNETVRVSVASSGVQSNRGSWSPSISTDGRRVAFCSDASNLVTGDTNGVYDVFMHDLVTNETVRVSVSSSGVQGDGYSCEPCISADGRYVAFDSKASNLVPGDTNGAYDVFLHDRVTGETVCVSISSSGEQGNEDSSPPSISADDRYVAFSSKASNLVPGDTNDYGDIFVHQCLPGVVVSAPDGWFARGWNYFSIPLDPTGSSDASDLLGFDGKDILYQWNPLRKNFERYPDDFTDLARGRGYRLRLKTDKQPSYEAYAPIGDFEIPLPAVGWTWIGQPFDHDTPLGDCLIRNNATGVTRTAWEDYTARDSWVNWRLVSWDPLRHTWIPLEPKKNKHYDTYLRPWHCYLVWAYERDLTLIVPEE